MCTRSIATRLLGAMTIVALSAAWSPVPAQEAEGSSAGPSAPPIIIDADSNFLDLRAGVNRFQDNVLITRGAMEVRADAGVVRQVEGRISDVELEGSPIAWRDQLDDGSIVTGESRALHFDVLANVVTLTGNAIIRHEQGEFTGDELVYDLTAESLAGRSTGNERVRVVIEPEAMSAPAPVPSGEPADTTTPPASTEGSVSEAAGEASQPAATESDEAESEGDDPPAPDGR